MDFFQTIVMNIDGNNLHALATISKRQFSRTIKSEKSTKFFGRISAKAMTLQISSNQIFHYTRCITPKRVTI